MATIIKSTTIRRSPDEVFAYLDDLAAHKEWQDGVEELRVVTEGPTRVGSEVEETRVVGPGRKIEMRWRVTEHDPATRRSAFETLESPMMKPSGVISVGAADGGSEVTFEMHTNPVGFGKLISPLMTRDVRKSIDGDLGRLKERLEGAGAGAPDPAREGTEAGGA
jgi:uncharacterized protein YndB with AHSA1/START domain